MTILESPLGKLYLLASDKGLKKLSYTKLPEAIGNKTIEQRAISELKEYFSGKRKEFSVPLDLIGTEFQKKVWEVLKRIGYGQVDSYTDVARDINNPKAVRAVGNANGNNPVPIIVPCHRVIASGGGLGGYSGGLTIKRKLLKIEKFRVIV